MGMMKVSRWGNSLAVRLPANVIKELGLREGDMIDPQVLIDARKSAEREAERQAALERMKARKWDLPADWKFDREEANAR